LLSAKPEVRGADLCEACAAANVSGCLALRSLTSSERNLLHNHPRSGMLPAGVYQNAMQKSRPDGTKKSDGYESIGDRR